MAMDKRFCNILLLGFGFMFVFTAFQSMSNMQKVVLDSVKREDTNFKGDGYTSLAIIYIVCSLANWVAPSVISIGGPRSAMVLGGITYLFYILTFLHPMDWLLYLASTVIGIGASLIWTGQGNYLTLNSDSDTMSRNSGLFWAMLQCSMLFGNFFVFMMFKGQTSIDKDTRTMVFSVLSAVCAVGVVLLLILRPAVKQNTASGNRNLGPFIAFKEALRLFVTKEMILLCFTFLYTGLELGFYSGVYSASIGFTKNIKNATELVGIAGICTGIGEIAGGLLFGLLGSKTVRWGRDPIVILGLIVHVISFFLIFLNIPDASPLGENTHNAFITSNGVLAVFCSVLLGFGDACFNTQIYTALGIIFPENSAPAFAIFKFTQSVAAACCFFYSGSVGLYYQLLILLIFGVVGTATFCAVEFMFRRQKGGYKTDSDAS